MAYTSAPAGQSLHILLVATDPTLEEELTSALAGVRDVRSVVHAVTTYRQALEVVRAREPRLIVVEMDRDAAEIAAFSRAVHELVPSALVTAVFRPDHLERTASESGMIITLLRAQVHDFFRRPLSTTELQPLLLRVPAAQADQADGESGRVLAFVSNKGGAGKSTLAVNTACALARRFPDQVLLVDTSLQLGTCAAMLDLSPRTTIIDAVRQSSRLDETLLRQFAVRHPDGLRLLAAPADALEAADVDDESIARILTLARRTFRFVVVDTFPILDSIVMAILDLSDVAFVVIQATAPSVAGAARLLPVLDSIGFPPFRQRLVLNYNFRNFLGNLAAGDVSARLGRELDYVVGYEKKVLVSLNTGQPFVLQASRWSQFARVVTTMAADLDTAPGPGERAARADDYGAPDRRRGTDRRVRNVGRPEGERRSGFDRRTGRPVVSVERTEP